MSKGTVGALCHSCQPPPNGLSFLAENPLWRPPRLTTVVRSIAEPALYRLASLCAPPSPCPVRDLDLVRKQGYGSMADTAWSDPGGLVERVQTAAREISPPDPLRLYRRVTKGNYRPATQPSQSLRGPQPGTLLAGHRPCPRAALITTTTRIRRSRTSRRETAAAPRWRIRIARVPADSADNRSRQAPD